MKTVILCGGLGTRLSEETKIKPKPMIKIGNKPILNHIIDIYKYYGFSNFLLSLGYKSEFIEKYYKNNKKLIGHFPNDLMRFLVKFNNSFILLATHDTFISVFLSYLGYLYDTYVSSVLFRIFLSYLNIHNVFL